MELKGHFKGRVPFVSIELQSHAIEALVDTGYDGDLLLPQVLIDSLDLTYLADTKYQTADGKIVVGSTYGSTFSWLGRDVKAEIDSTEGSIALLGMGLLHDCRVEMEASKGVLVISRKASTV